MSAPRRHVLLVDDNEADVMLALAALELSGLDAQVSVVQNGQEALEFLRREGGYADREPGDPTLVLLDINMPGMNGFDALEEIRRDRGLRHLPVVMLTSSSAERDIHASYRRGTNAYVVKPVSFDGTVTAMQNLTAFWMTLNRTASQQERPLPDDQGA